jgi:hypothetical protein
LRVITTTLVSVKTFFSSATRSAFRDRSMPTPNIRSGLRPNELQQMFEANLERSCPWGGDRWRCMSNARRSGAPLRMIPFPVSAAD